MREKVLLKDPTGNCTETIFHLFFKYSHQHTAEAPGCLDFYRMFCSMPAKTYCWQALLQNLRISCSCGTLISSSLECMYNVAQTDWFGTVLLGAPVVSSGLAPVRVMLDGSSVFTAIFSLLPTVNHHNACLSRQITLFCIHQKLDMS